MPPTLDVLQNLLSSSDKPREIFQKYNNFLRFLRLVILAHLFGNLDLSASFYTGEHIIECYEETVTTVRYAGFHSTVS